MVRDLAAWLAHQEALHPEEIDLSLARVAEVAARMEVLPCATRTVLVAGTNGKGSTVTWLEAMLLAQGEQRVGTYTSPHIWRYNERIRIHGEPVSDEQLVAAFEAVEAARGDLPLTYFEFGTLAAFRIQRDAALDVAVLEVGLGGRLDATNVVDPDVCIITSIGLDHQDLLGPDREAIAKEKAGILRPGVTAIIAERDPPLALTRAAAVCDDHWIGDCFDGLELAAVAGDAVTADLMGAALHAYAQLVPEERWRIGRAREALIAAAPRARCELLPGTPSLLLDVGHDPTAAARLASLLTAREGDGRRIAVFGMLRGKDLEGYLDTLEPQVDAWIVCELATPRARPSEELVVALRARGAEVLSVAPDPATGLDEARSRLHQTRDLVLVIGSFHTVGGIPERDTLG